MTTDNRTNEPTEAQVEAAAKIIRRASLETTADPGDFWSDCYEEERERWRNAARAALVAAQGAAPQAESDTTGQLTASEANAAHLRRGIEELGAPVLPSSGVDEDALARLLCEKNYVSPDGKPTCAACRDKAHEVAEWLKVQGGESRGDR